MSSRPAHEHTPEPWSFDDGVLWGDEGNKVVSRNDWWIDRDDARRIVACVNACAGMTTQDLEAIDPGGLHRVFQRYLDIVQEAVEANDDRA